MSDKDLIKDITILFVDDEIVILNTISEFLEHHTRVVYKAANGEEALRTYKEKRPDILITDIAMPGMGGFELIAEARAIDSELSVIICSGYDEREFLLNAIALGVNEYLVKPIDRNVLLQYVIKCTKDLTIKRENHRLSNIQNLILTATQEGVFGIDINGNHTFVNPAAAAMLGYTQDELLGKHSHSTWHHTKSDGSPFQSYECPIYRALQDGIKAKMDNDTFWRKDGSSFRAGYISAPLVASSGEILGAVVTFWDVTEKRRMDEKLKILSLVVEESSSAVVITDTDGNIEYVNKRFCQMSGYTKDEAIGQNPRILRYEENPREIYEDMWATIIAGNNWEREIQNKKKDGTLYWCRLSIFPLHEDNMKVDKFVSIFMDVTAAKEYERELKNINEVLEARVAQEVEKNREKDTALFEQAKLSAIGEMIKDIAHHWRQPLTAIGMMIHNLKDSYDFGELTKETMDEMVDKSMEQLQMMSKTIDNFRNFFKPNEKKTYFGAKKALEDAVFMVSVQLKAQFIETIITENSSEPIMLFGYHNDFKQISLNIIKNSADAILERLKKEGSSYSGKMWIEISKEESLARISFRDNGGGIPDEVSQKMFNPYFSTKSQQSGAGVGLYMSKMVVEKNMGGTLIYNKIEDGAEFVIEMPCTQNSRGE